MKFASYLFLFVTLSVGAVFADDFQPTVENRAPAPGPAPTGMVWIPGGEFSMGSKDPRGDLCGGTEPMDDARPVRRVYVDGFWMDRTAVTNAEYARFVTATGYVTVAERPLRAADFPGVPAAQLAPGAVVFTPPASAVPLDNPFRWWAWVPGASWRHPEGPASNLTGRDHYPVVQVAYEDAAAYAAWAGKDLPTEAQWEFAARGGLTGALYPWGNDLTPGGRWMANIFEGHFPYENTRLDGFTGLAPVASFPPNAYGLHDVAGNAWEWCKDWYLPVNSAKREVLGTYAPADAGGRTLGRQQAATGHTGPAAAGNGAGVVRNPTGPTQAESFDPGEPGVAKRVQRGGSFLCTDQYCTRYMVGSRGKAAPDTGSNHAGFRCIKAP